jgi:predicted Zn finger-like uncharacterized protein
MHIVCPNCAASYQVSASAIGAAGRSVRCVRCRSVWHQQPQAEVAPLAAVPPPLAPRGPVSEAIVAAFRSELGHEPPPPAADTAPPVETPAAAASENGDPAGPSLAQLIESPSDAATDTATEPELPAGAALPEIAIAAERAPPIAPQTPAADEEPQPSNIESIAARRGRRSNARRRISVRSARTPAVILLLVGVVAALIAWRGSIVRHAPQMASLYGAIGLPVNLRGLNFTEVKVSRDIHDGVAVLVVEGSIVSAASKPVEVPRLRFAMRNEAGGEIYAWTAMPAREVLEPGETLAFRSRLASPPGEGRDVTVRFFNRLDAVAGLR